MIRAGLALLVVVLVRGAAFADADADADAAFRAVAARAAAGDPEALEAFESLGASSPSTRWTDNAWAEAARLAERAGQIDRARADLERVVAITADDQLRRRARAAIVRLDAITGGGRWSAVAVAHEQLTSRVFGGGDPRPGLVALEALVASNPGYPRANAARLTIAKGWEQEADADRAIAWLREAAEVDAGQDARLELARALIRAGRLEDSAGVLRTLAEAPTADRAAVGLVARLQSQAEQRSWLRRALWGMLAAIFAVAVVALRRDAGSWKRAARRLARPPTEALFLVPIAMVLVFVASTGNPLVARAVRAIAIVGVVVTWLSGVLLDAARARGGGVGARRAFAQAALAVLAVGGATYLAIDRDRMIDLLIETWRGGPSAR